MAILYILQVNDPNNAGSYPPSIVASSWYTALTTEVNTHGLGPNATMHADETALNNWINRFKLTDPTLLSDLALWKTAHGVSYTNIYYNVSSSGITNPGLVG